MWCPQWSLLGAEHHGLVGQSGSCAPKHSPLTCIPACTLTPWCFPDSYTNPRGPCCLQSPTVVLNLLEFPMPLTCLSPQINHSLSTSGSPYPLGESHLEAVPQDETGASSWGWGTAGEGDVTGHFQGLNLGKDKWCRNCTCYMVTVNYGTPGTYRTLCHLMDTRDSRWHRW